MQPRDRIVDFIRVPAAELRPNPKNWRTHPTQQQDILKGLLASIGIANAVLARKLDDGSLMLIDGHLRAETLGAGMVPVLVLDVTEQEADALLVTMDPLAALAGQDDQKLYNILQTQIEFDSKALNDFIKQGLDETTQNLLEAMAAEEVAAESNNEDFETDAGPAEPISGDFTNFTFPVTSNQERIVRAAIHVAKERFGVVNTGEAMTAICKEWVDEHEVRD